MNERIEKLAEQSGLYDEKTPEEVPGFTASFEKFAELIVKECANFVDYRLTNPDGASMAWCDGSDIKKHFGVEE